MLIALAQVLGLSLWFSASAVTADLKSDWHLDAVGVALLTTSVQLGFIAGALLATVFNLADIFHTPRLFALASVLGAAANGIFALFVSSLGPGLALRFLTGVFLAGVYPPGIKLMSSWFQRGRGLAVGLLIGALTLGSALPRLVAFGGYHWQAVVGISSLLALAGGLLVLLFVPEGPYVAPSPPLDLTYIGRIVRDRPLRLAVLGYCGHMWELYAMWTWVPAYLAASFAASSRLGSRAGNLVGFFVIGIAGFAGCVGGGWLADRLGRTLLTAAAMLVSGACALASAVIFGLPPAVVCVVAGLWGLSVIADSAQFSVAVTELSDPRYVGTALAFQLSVGFLLTVITIQLTSLLASSAGWRWAFLLLVPGPALGALAMLRLRSQPESVKLAHGLK